MLRGLLIGLLTLTSAAAADPVLSHQGRILDALGYGENNTVDLRVSLFATETAPTAFWSRQFADLVLQDGYYSVALVRDDSNVALSLNNFADGEAWVQVEVNNAEMGQRELLSSVPFALRAGSIQLPDRTPGTCTTPGELSWDSSTNRLAVCNGSTSQVIANPPDILSTVQADSLDLGGDVAISLSSFGASVGRVGFYQQTAFAVCAANHSTMRYLESPGPSQTCSSKCSDSEKPGNACLGSYATGGNLTPWNDYGCATSNESLQWCCCSW